VSVDYEMAGTENEEAPNLSARVSVKLPPYWPKDPTLWFAQAEAQFAIGGITKEETKFYYIVSHLSPEAAAEVRDLILKLSANSYQKLECNVH